MNLVFIYGPPGVGKYTVAKDLSKKTGYKLLHNHLVVDLVTSIFDFASEEAHRLSDKFRKDTILEAANAKVKGMIFTLVYAYGVDDKLIKEIVNIVEGKKGKVFFVRLFCTKKELEKRLQQEPRKQFSKATDINVLKEILKKYEVGLEVPNSNSLEIDNTNLLPEVVSDKIIQHYHI